VADEAPLPMERIRVAEVIGALSFATDLGIGVPLEHGLQSTLLAMRLAERLKVDAGRSVRLLARGLPTKQIARSLGISVKTADNHIQNAFGKIGVSTRAAAAVFAMRHGLVP
jgi:DNA-binding CsgD family transcriptional regulator